MRGILGVTLAGLGALACAACADPIALRSQARMEAPRPAPSGLSERILRITPPVRAMDPRVVGRGPFGGEPEAVPAVLLPPPPMIEPGPVEPAPTPASPPPASEQAPASSGRPINLLPPGLPRLAPTVDEPLRGSPYEPAVPLPPMGRSEAERLASARPSRSLPIPAPAASMKPTAPSSRGLALPVPTAPQ